MTDQSTVQGGDPCGGARSVVCSKPDLLSLSVHNRTHGPASDYTALFPELREVEI